jgi:hypothetical protein
MLNRDPEQSWQDSTNFGQGPEAAGAHLEVAVNAYPWINICVNSM